MASFGLERAGISQSSSLSLCPSLYLPQPSDWGLGWIAVILGVLSLYVYLSSKSNRRDRRRLRGMSVAFLSPTDGVHLVYRPK